MDEDRICRQDQAKEELAVVGKRLWRRGKPGAAGHQAAITEGRVGAACQTQMPLCLVRFSKDRSGQEWPFLRREAGQDPRQKHDLGRCRGAHFQATSTDRKGPGPYCAEIWATSIR
jgi:hypothetical protein